MSPRRSLCTITVVLGIGSLLGCNALTGADDLEIGEDGSGSGKGNGSGSGSGSGSGAGAGEGGAGNGGLTGGAGTGGGSTQQPLMVEAQGVTIQEVAIYQGVRRPLMEGGVAATSGVPIVAGRDALIRVFVATDGTYLGAPVTARFTIEGQTPFEVTQAANGGPVEGQLDTTINFDVPGTSIPVGGNYRVELLQAPEVSPGGNAGASFPAGGGFQSLGAQSPGASLKVMLIPVSYQADGSNRLPDTSSSQLQRYINGFYGIYPVPDVDIEVHAAVGWDGTLSAGGSGWESLLNAIADLRNSENASANTYYYGIFSPASSIGQFCGGGCVAGLGFVGGPADDYTRAAIGLGFSGDSAVETAIHEVGHNHGRNHAPCGGASGADSSFPYSGGSIGSWGYDLVSGSLKNPQQHADLMGYCDPTWVSDYTFSALFNRLKAVNGANLVFPPELLDQTWERVSIGGNGSQFLEPITMHRPPLGEALQITAVGDNGTSNLEGRFFPYDHIEGGVLFWKKGSQTIHSVAFELDGSMLQVIK